MPRPGEKAAWARAIFMKSGKVAKIPMEKLSD